MTPKENVMLFMRREIEDFIEDIKSFIADGADYSELQEAIDWLDMLLDFVKESEEEEQ